MRRPHRRDPTEGGMGVEPSGTRPSRRIPRRVGLALLLVLGVSGLVVIAAVWGPRDEPEVVPASTFFPTWNAGGASQGVFIGRLTERDGCVFLRSLGEDHLPLWPSGTRWDRGTLIAGTGSAVADATQVVTAIVTLLDSRADAERLVGGIPDRCVPTGGDPFVRIFDVARAPEELERGVVVPDVVGLADAEADGLLREHVLDAAISTVPSSRANAGSVIRQRPTADTFVEMGTRVRVIVGAGPVRRVPVPDLPPIGVVVPHGAGVRLVGLDGQVVRELRHHRVVDNGLGPVYLQHGRVFYLLDPDARALVPVSERQAQRTYHDPPEPDIPEPEGVYRHAGHWRFTIDSPVSGDRLGQWSGECEVPHAVWIRPDGSQQLVTGHRSLRGAPESLALGWSPDGEAIVLLPAGICGPGSSPPGVYGYRAPGDGRLIVEADAADLWTTAERASP